MRKRIGIDFCCNDPDNGLFAGRVEAIQFDDGGDPLFELESRRQPSPCLTILADGNLRIAGKRWEIEASKDWVGNWCWNQYVFTVDRAIELLIWLRGRGLFDLTTGEHRLYQAWRKPPGDAELRPLLVELLGVRS